MNSSILAANLRRLRQEKKYTQEQAAERLSVSPQSVSRWECGATLPEVTLLPDIARLYAVTVDDLFRDSCAAYPNYAARLLAVYEVSGQLEDFFAARREYEKLLASGEYTSDDLRCYGVLYHYLCLQAGDRAMAHFDRVIEREEKDRVYYSTWQQKMALMARTSRGREAIDIQKERLEREKDDPKQWVLLVAAYTASREYSAAREVVMEALERFPDEALLCIYAGDICQALKQYEEAFAWWEKAKALDPDAMDPWYSMAFCCEELGEYERACRLWQDVIDQLTRRGMEVEKALPLEHMRQCGAKAAKNGG